MKMQGRKQYFGKYYKDETRSRYKNRMWKPKWKVAQSPTQEKRR
jgi:hypothetical protein